MTETNEDAILIKMQDALVSVIFIYINKYIVFILIYYNS